MGGVGAGRVAGPKSGRKAIRPREAREAWEASSAAGPKSAHPDFTGGAAPPTIVQADAAGQAPRSETDDKDARRRRPSSKPSRPD